MTGLATESILAQKLWLANKVAPTNPWGVPLVQLTTPQLDWLLEMYARENPRDFTFVRDGKASDGSGERKTMAAWSRVLSGPALREYLHGKWAPKATERWLKDPRNRDSDASLKPGITRGGKRLKNGQGDDRGPAAA